MKIDVLTVFPEMVQEIFSYGVIGQSLKKKLLEIKAVDLRDFTEDKHRSVDGKPFGGGPGMVMRVDVIDRAIQELTGSNEETSVVVSENARTKSDGMAEVGSRRAQARSAIANGGSDSLKGPPVALFQKQDTHFLGRRIVLLSPQGKTFSQKKAKELAKLDHLILISGRYEGVDERVREHLVDEEISIGDYVLSGGEIPAMVVVDAVARLIAGVVGDSESLKSESFNNGRLDFGQYTHPEGYKKWRVPPVLRSGNHAEIEKWRAKQAELKTKRRRPDLLSE